MSELGTRLQTARLEKGYSLDELQQITKIQKRYLEAIEDGDFSRMPGEFYSRAFVKSYAEAVGLDPHLIFVEHHGELPEPKKSQMQELPPRTSRNKSPAASRKKSNVSSLLPSILGIIFVAAVGLVVWIFYQDDEQAGVTGNNNQQEQSADNENLSPDNTNESSFDNEGPALPEEEDILANEENNADNDENGDLNNNESEEAGLVFSEADGNRYTYVQSGTDELEVELTFSGPSWILITNGDGDELHQQEHVDGDEEIFDFSDENELIFNMGSTPTATLYINGEELEYESDEFHQYIIIEQDNS